MEQNPKAKRGYSREWQSGLFAVGDRLGSDAGWLSVDYEVMNGNTSDRAALPGFLKKIESTYGKARCVWMMVSGPPV
jgi:hypothetical protein